MLCPWHDSFVVAVQTPTRLREAERTSVGKTSNEALGDGETTRQRQEKPSFHSHITRQGRGVYCIYIDGGGC